MSAVQQPRQVRQVTSALQTPRRRSKQESLRIVQALKRGTLIASTLIFGGFVVLVARHNVHADATSSSNDSSNSAAPSSQFESPRGSGGHDYFNNPNQGQSGYGVGAGSNQPPVTGSSSS